jgi:hypothetical protein
VADWAGLENRCGGNVTEGSNPSLSAKKKNVIVTCLHLQGLTTPAIVTEAGCEKICVNANR